MRGELNHRGLRGGGCQDKAACHTPTDPHHTCLFLTGVAAGLFARPHARKRGRRVHQKGAITSLSEFSTATAAHHPEIDIKGVCFIHLQQSTVHL